MFFLLLLLSLICLVYLYDCTIKREYRWKKLCEFPGDTPLPIVGNSLQLGFDADESANKIMAMWEKHGKQNFRVTVGFENWIMLSDPDDIATILMHKTELSKTLERNMAITPFFGNSLSTSEGVRWKSIRKYMYPSFHFKSLEDKLNCVNEYSDRLFEIFDFYENKGPIEVYRYLRPYIFDNLCLTLMGVETHFLAEPDNAYLKACGQVVRILSSNSLLYWMTIPAIFRMTPFYKKMMGYIKTIRQTSSDIIAERREKIKDFVEEIRKNNKNTKINLETLIESKLNKDGCLLDRFLISKSTDGKPTIDEIINEEISLLCFTGQMTTALSISHNLYLLAKYPNVQNQVLEEQLFIFKDDFHKKPTMYDLNEMKYLEVVIKETFRVIPIASKLGRRLQNDLTFKDGRVAPAGTTVIAFLEAISRNPKVFSEPEKFKPERFLEPMHPYASLPFSAGPRNCIGFRYAWMMMKATLSNILRRYEVILGGPGTEPQFASRFMTESTNGVQIILKRRHLPN